MKTSGPDHSKTCRELGFQAVEVNASDTRNKADASAVKGIAGKLSNSLHVLSTNASLGGPRSKVRDI